MWSRRKDIQCLKVEMTLSVIAIDNLMFPWSKWKLLLESYVSHSSGNTIISY